MSFPRYSAYKPSGVEWLGEVPEHWSIIRLKNVLQCRITDGPHTTPEFIDEGVPFLSVDGIQDGELRFDGCRFISEKDHEEFSRKAQPVRDDILMGKAASTGKIARVKTDFTFSIWSPLALIRVDSQLSSPSFYEQALKSAISQAQIDVLCTSNTQKNISMDDIPRLVMTRPTIEEQLAIATFLDHETAKIDALIAEQQRLIELLQEKRQSVISHAVTKGLNPDAPMKDSGVEWLGEVPEHWSTTALKRIVSVCGRIGFRGYTTEDLVPEGEGALVLGGANLTSEGRLDLSKQTFISWHKYEESPEIKVSINDLVIGQRGTCGKVVMIDHDIGPATINPSLVLLKRPTVDSEFLCYWLMGDLVQSIFESFLNATAVPMLSQQQIGNVRVIYPPLDEQRAIVSFVTAETAGLDTLTAEAKCAIALLQERRSALISAAVTGQIDVRGLVPEAEAA